jgi:hypothetical protein
MRAFFRGGDPMGNAPAPTEWRNPVIIAAIVGAVAVIIAALIGLTPKSKVQDARPQQTTIINQKTSGSGSSAVGHVGRDFTNIINQQGTPKN